MAAALVVALTAPAGTEAGKPKESGRPSVKLRAAPRVAPAPARIVFTVDIEGGADDEAVHCLKLEWSWGDGTHSRSEGDCSEFTPGKTAIQRVFQADHEYRLAGNFSAQVKVRKGERVLGRDSVSLTIGAGKRDTTFEIRRQ